MGAFTLIELLVVIAIIAILAALVLGAVPGVQQRAARSRAYSEIEAMKMKLEEYKIDNGGYPIGNTTASSGSIMLGPPATPYYPTYADATYPSGANLAVYQTASEALYQALAGQSNFSGPPTAGVKSYMSFRANQVGNASPSSALTYVADPWNNPYGYSNGDALNPQVQYPNNGTHSFDLWSTAGTKGANPTTDANAWITNWQ